MPKKSSIFFLPLLIKNILISNDYNFISFDHSDHFGEVSKNGVVVWNQDWHSGNLLFDGTWANYPGMYGPYIKKNYNRSEPKSVNVDTNHVDSYFNYSEGDYGFNNFSVGLGYLEKNRHLQLEGFKRSYLGPYNQFNSYSNQPLQQSYLLSYLSKNDKEYGGITIGHFNSFSGLFDQNNGAMDSQINSINLHYKFIINNLKWFANVDQFMQRFNLVHSKSIFDKVRYLGRREYSFGFRKYSVNDFLEANFVYNSRSITFEGLQKNSWSKLNLSMKRGPFFLKSSYFRTKNNHGLDYLFEVDKNINLIDLLFETSLINKLFHPNHVYMYSDFSTKDTYTVFSSKVSMRYANLKNKILLSFNVLSELNNKLLEKLIPITTDGSKSIDNQSFCLNLLITRKILNNSKIKFNYEQRNPHHYSSGGYGKLIKLNFTRDLKLFQRYMSSIISVEHIYIGDRISRSGISFLEYIPNSTGQSTRLENINFLNAFIQISVSDFTFKYEWKNFSQNISEAKLQDNITLTKINPEMLPIGALMNFSVEWHFNN